MSAVKGLSNVQMRAGAAALALVLCMLLPWYSASYGKVHNNLSAFGAFSWVEAAVLVISGAIVYLLYARSQQRGFHLPGGDGWAVTIAGSWTLFLLVWRLFDRPDVEKGSVGVQWGLFVTMLVAGALAAAGQAMRAEHKPEPPNPAAEDLNWSRPPAAPTRRMRRPADSAAITKVLRDDPRPAWEGEPPPPPTRAEPARPKPPPEEGKLF